MADTFPGNAAIGNAFGAGLTYAWKDWLRICGNTDPAEATGVIPRVGADAADVGAAIHGALDAIGPTYDHVSFEAISGPVCSKLGGDVFLAAFAMRSGHAFSLTPGGALQGVAPRLRTQLAAVVHTQLAAELGASGPYPSNDTMAAAIVTSVWLVYCAFLRAVGLTDADIAWRTRSWDANDNSSPIWVAVAPFIYPP